MSRKRARSEFSKEDLMDQLGHVVTVAHNMKSLLDEAPLAYKDIDEVIFTLVESRNYKPVIKLKPLGF